MACEQDTIHILLQTEILLQTQTQTQTQTQEEERNTFYLLTTHRADDQDAKKTFILTSPDTILYDMFVVNQNFLFSGSRYYGFKQPEAAFVLKNFEEDKTQIQVIPEINGIAHPFLLEDQSIMVFGNNVDEDGNVDGRIICNTYSLLH